MTFWSSSFWWPCCFLCVARLVRSPFAQSGVTLTDKASLHRLNDEVRVFGIECRNTIVDVPSAPRLSQLFFVGFSSFQAARCLLLFSFLMHLLCLCLVLWVSWHTPLLASTFLGHFKGHLLLHFTIQLAMYWSMSQARPRYCWSMASTLSWLCCKMWRWPSSQLL